jgi:hypothetical protein
LTRIEHLVLTRFSVKLLGPTADDGFAPEWLEERLRLFDDYPLASLRAQTRGDFRWLVFCDPSTDSACLDALRARSETVPGLEVVLAPSGRFEDLDDLVRDAVDPEAEIVMTTRLDSDDAFHVDAMRILAEYAEEFAETTLPSLVVNFPRGYQLDVLGRRLYERYYMKSPFLTLIERKSAKPLDTILMAQHTEVPQRVLTHQDISIVGWLQAVHGSNVTNAVVDDAIEVPLSELEGAFALGADWQNAPAER